MDTIRVWPVKPGQVYRPVFDAEEQLLQSIKKRKKNLEDKLISSPSASGDFSTDSLECENYGVKKISTEVFNLPDRLPPIEHTEPSDRLRRIKERRETRHQHIVNTFNNSMKDEMQIFKDRTLKLTELLHNTVQNNGQISSDLISDLDEEHKLVQLEETQLLQIWEYCKERHKNTQNYIEKYTESYQILQDRQMNDVKAILQTCLSSMLENAHLPKEDNYKVIETESMVLNQAALSNARTAARLVKNISERETQRALQMRIDYIERKANWSQLKTSSRIAQFKIFLSQPSVNRPSKIDVALDDLRVAQSEVVTRRNDFISEISTVNPENTDEKFVENWISGVNKAQSEHSGLIQNCLNTSREAYQNSTELLFDEEQRLEKDLLELCDEDEVERLLEGLRMQVDELNHQYTQQLHEMDIYFEDISLRSGRQLVLIGRMLKELVAVWRNTFRATEQRQYEFDLEMSVIRHDHDMANQESEATITLRVNELRQANDIDRIQKYQKSLERQLEQMLESYKLFTTQQTRTTKAYKNVISKEIEIYEHNLQSYCDIEEEDLIEMEPWEIPSEKSVLELLPKETKVSRDKWVNILTNRWKKLNGEEQSTTPRKTTLTDYKKDIYIKYNEMVKDEIKKDSPKKGNKYGQGKSSQKSMPLKKLPNIKKSAKKIKKGSPAEAVESPKPYSLLAMLGDDFLSDENCIPVYRECLLLDSNLQDIRNDLKTCFARHFESYKDRRIRTLEVQLDELVSVLTTEYEIKQQLNEERLERITNDISEVRSEELKLHNERYNAHENEIYQILKEMMKHVNDCTANAEQTLQLIDHLSADDGKCKPNFALAKNARECEDIKLHIQAEYETVANKLHENMNLFIETSEEIIREIKESNEDVIRQMILFKKGGNFSKKEVELYKIKIKKLESKTVRFYQTQVREMNSKLPEMVDRVNLSRDQLVEQLQTHITDLKITGDVSRIQREYQILIKSEIARTEQVVTDAEKESQLLKRYFAAFWRPQYDLEKKSPAELNTWMNNFKATLAEAIFDMRKNLTQPDDRKEFYQKWLLNKLPVLSAVEFPGSSKLGSRRESAINSFAGTPKSPRKAAPRSSKVVPRKAESGHSRTDLSQSQSQSGTETNGLVRRIIRDAKTEVKFQIFNMVAMPEPIDFPNRVTRLLFEQTDKIQIAYETYYRQKGIRVVTRPQDIPDNFDRCLEKIRIEMSEQEMKAVSRCAGAFNRLSIVFKTIEDLDEKLPEILLTDFCTNLEKNLKSNMNEIKLRRQKLMDAYEEAKNEHFNSLRIKLGHPEFEDLLTNLKKRENQRKKKHSRAIKDRAEVLCETIQANISDGLKDFVLLIKDSSDRLDGRILFDHIISIACGEKQDYKWPALPTVDLPVFETIPFISKRRTPAHVALFKARDIFFLKIKTTYQSEIVQIKTDESDQLEEITRWVQFWKLQLSEVLACYNE